MNSYFNNKNYIAIYLHNIFDAFAKSIITIFGVVLLYKIGFPIWLILLFFAFQFGFMGLLSPLSPILISKIGLIKSILVSNIFRILGTSIILLTQDFNSWYLFLVFIFFSIDGAIYHPLIHGISANYIEDEHKGRFNSLNTILKQVSIIISVFVGGYFVANSNNEILLVLIIISFILSNLSYFFFLDKKEKKYNYKIKEIFKYLYSPTFKENLIPFSFQTFFIIERLFIPLFIFIVVGNFQILSYIIGFAILIEFIILFFFGKKIDKLTNKSFFQATLLKSINSLFFIFLNFNTWLVFFNKTYSGVTENMFDNAFGTLLQKKANKENDPILFTTAKEMILCFTEFFILIFFSGIAYFIGNIIFTVIFASSFIAIWITYKTWKN